MAALSVRRAALISLAVGLLSLVLSAQSVAPPIYDVVIRNGLVLDGAGNPSIRADVAIKGGRFARIGIVPGRGRQEIDATGRYVSPTRYPEGIDWVLVNGEIVIDRGRHTGARPGKVLYGPGRRIAEQQAEASRPILAAPVDVAVLKAPAPFKADGKTHLVYKVTVANLHRPGPTSRAVPITLETIGGNHVIVRFPE